MYHEGGANIPGVLPQNITLHLVIHPIGGMASYGDKSHILILKMIGGILHSCPVDMLAEC